MVFVPSWVSFFRAQGVFVKIGRVNFVYALLMFPCRALITG